MTPFVRALTARDLHALQLFLAAGESRDTWLLHALDMGGTRGFIGAFAEGALCGVAYHRRGAASAASRSSDDALQPLADALSSRLGGRWVSVIGADRACSVVVNTLTRDGPARVDRKQLFMSVRDPARLAPGETALRPGRPADLERLVPLVSSYRVEDGLAVAGEDQQPWVREHVGRRIDDGLIHVYEEGGEIVFTGAFNYRGDRGAALGGIYTVPASRGRGIARRCVAQLCRLGLTTAPIVSLHVDAANAAAIRCYEAAGLERDGDFRLAFR